MDLMILESQKWLNKEYGGDSRYNRVEEDGKTGQKTINGLLRALQIEFGITSTADNFGPTTERKFKERFPNGILQQSETSTDKDNIFGIIQCALWCKGYEAVYGKITCEFKKEVATSIKKLKNDAGLDNSNATISLNLMKALLSMDQFVLLKNYGGTKEIREIQRTLNGKYPEYIGIIPCDGVYGRSMNKALIKVLQCIEGMSPDEATGTFGPATTEGLSKLVINESFTGEAVRLFRYCMTCNQYSTGSNSTSWDSVLGEKIKEFQKMYVLPVTGIGDKNTWMSLLTSKGNPDRDALACDCATILNLTKATSLYNADYRYVGRYLTGTVGGTQSKAMTREEIQSIIKAGLRIFAIFQEGIPSLDRYKFEEGRAEGAKAMNAALKLGIPENEIIYFAIDYDVMDGEVGLVKDYFRGVNRAFDQIGHYYRIGIYGARNVCTKVCKDGLAISSFVSDMSTGFSGNMGYVIPDNWAFDQFHEYNFGSKDGVFPLDHDAYSGRYSGFAKVNDPSQTLPDVSEEYRREKAVEFMESIGLLLGSEFTFGAKYTEMLGYGMEVTYTVLKNVSTGSARDMSSEVTVDVTDGKYSAELSTSLEYVYGQLDTKYTVDIGLKNVEMLSSMAVALKDGTLTCSTGIDITGAVIFRVNAKQYLRTSGPVHYTQDYEIEYRFIPYNGDPGSEEAYDLTEIKEAIMEFIKEHKKEIIIVTASIVLGYVLGPYILSLAGSGLSQLEILSAGMEAAKEIMGICAVA